MSRRADIALRDTDLDHLLLARLPSRLATLLLALTLLASATTKVTPLGSELLHETTPALEVGVLLQKYYTTNV